MNSVFRGVQLVRRSLVWQTQRFATKKAAGSTKNGRDSNPKFLGVKQFGGHTVAPGNIIVRQRGTHFYPGFNVGVGRDHTIFAKAYGTVRFFKDPRSGRNFINVEPNEKVQVYLDRKTRAQIP
jgi:large subunit ribosomal protein L27